MQDWDVEEYLWGLVRTRVVGIDSLPMSTFSDVGRGTRCARFPCGEMPGDRGLDHAMDIWSIKE
jgi:hypothetical protein